MDRGLPDMRATRARGLKQLEREAMFRNPRRAHAGAWIETMRSW